MSEPRWRYRTNRAFGVMDQDEELTFENDDDPVMISLVGAGYIDLVSGPPLEGIQSGESFGTPSIVMEPPK